MRIDSELVKRNIYASRTRATRAISEGLVSVNGVIVTKASFNVEENDIIEAKEDPVPYVGRGAFKLKGALEQFKISPEGMDCIDIGSSTGGFTEILLKNGAKTVTCVDVGHDQLAESLRNDERVTVMEGFDARRLPEKEELLCKFDFASIDVSFISLDKILPSAYAVIKSGGICIALIKPQFEAGKKQLNKNGIVKSQEAHRIVLDNFKSYTSSLFNIEQIIPSPIEGGDGNKEYLAYLVK